MLERAAPSNAPGGAASYLARHPGNGKRGGTVTGHGATKRRAPACGARPASKSFIIVLPKYFGRRKHLGVVGVKTE